MSRCRSIVFIAVALAAATALPAAPATVRGTVRTADGEPLAGARVDLLPLSSNFEWARRVLEEGRAVPDPTATAETDSRGRFALEAPLGLWHVEAGAPGFVPMRFGPLPTANSSHLPAVALLMDDGAEVETVDSSGRAAPGVWIYAESDSEDLWTASDRLGWQVATRAGTSDADGRLRLPRAPGEALVLSAFLPGGGRRALATGARRATLVLGSPAELRTLAVRTASLRPAPDWLIATGPLAWPAGRTDADGRLRLRTEVPAELHLFAADGQRHSARWTDGAGGDPVVLPPAKRAVGRVIDAESRQGVAGALVWPAHDPGTVTASGDDGAYDVAAPSAGDTFWIAAAASGYLPQVAWIRQGGAGRAVTLELTAAVGAGGQVVDPAGKAVSDAGVEATVRGGGPRVVYQVSRGVSDADGRFTLGNLHPEAVYEVAVLKAGFAPARLELTAPGRSRRPLRIRLAPSRRAFGVVADLDGEPVSGAELRLRAAAGAELRQAEALSARSDGAGRFEFAELPAEKVDLEARKPGFAAFLVRGIQVPEDGDVDLGTLFLEPGVALHGSVVDPRGEPVAGAEVWAAADAGRATGDLEAAVKSKGPGSATGDDGGFSVDDLESGERYHLFVDHQDFLPASVAGIEVPFPEPLVVVLEPAAAVTGRVLDGGAEPIAGAAVSLRREAFPEGRIAPLTAGAGEERTVLSRDDGTFRFLQVAAGEVAVEASARGYLPAAPLAVEVPDGGSVRVPEIVLERGAVVEGEVRSRESEPVESAQVRSGRATTFSDATGYYLLEGVRPGRVEVQARHPEYDRAVREVDVVLSGANRADFVLDGGWRVAGKVTDDGGAAVAGARLELRRLAARDSRRYSAVSDDAGRFLVSRAANGSYRIEADLEGYAAGRETFEVRGGPVDGLEVRLAPGTALGGRVRGLEQDELADVRVRADRADGYQRAGSVDFDGAYRIADLGPGDWRVVAGLGDGSREAEARVVIEPGTRKVTRDLEFSRGVALFGRVFFRGEPLSEALVSVVGHEIAARRSVRTNHEGRYRLEDLEPGRYRLSLSHPRELVVHSEELELAGDRLLDVEIATAAVSGVVVSEASSEPLAGARVGLQQVLVEDPGSGSVIALATDAEGRFHIARVTAGRHRLTVHMEGYAPLADVLEVEAGAEVHGLELALAPVPGLDLVVRYADGAAPGFVTIGIYDQSGRLTYAEARASAGGTTRLSTLAAGTWTVRVGASRAAAVEARVTVPGPPLEVVLPPATRLEVRVPSLAESNRLATLTLTGEDGELFEVVEPSGLERRQWDFDGGTVLVDGLPAGVWTARVASSDGRSWEKTLVTSGEPRRAVALE